MKKALCLLAVLCLLLAGCGGNEEIPEATILKDDMPVVGICLPGTSDQWEAQADRLGDILWELGYTAQTLYADNNARTQLSQVQEFVDQKVACLVIAAVDPLPLTAALDAAKTSNIPIVAYDRMLTYTDAASYCVAPDGYAAGQQLARYILDTTDPDNAQTPLTIEFFMGSPEDTNSLWMHQGVMSLLQSYLDSGKLVCRSGRTAFEDVCVLGNNTDSAWERCYDLLAGEYDGTRPDIICAGADSLTEGCITALETFGFMPEENWPVLTGVGATEEGLTRIKDGYQAITLSMDANALADACGNAVHTLLSGEKLQNNVYINNGAADVSCLFLPYTVITAENYTAFLPSTEN